MYDITTHKTFTQTIVDIIVTPTTCRMIQTLHRAVIETAELRGDIQSCWRKSRAFVCVSSPFTTLSIGETSYIGITIHTSLITLTPGAITVCTILTIQQRTKGWRTNCIVTQPQALFEVHAQQVCKFWQMTESRKSSESGQFSNRWTAEVGCC